MIAPADNQICWPDYPLIATCSECACDWPFRPNRPPSVEGSDLFRGTKDGHDLYILAVCPDCGAEWIGAPEAMYEELQRTPLTHWCRKCQRVRLQGNWSDCRVCGGSRWFGVLPVSGA